MAKPQLIATSEIGKSEPSSGKCSACGAVMYSMTSDDLNRVFATHVKELHIGEDANQIGHNVAVQFLLENAEKAQRKQIVATASSSHPRQRASGGK